MRDRKFYINSIKMDLHRVVTATGDIRKEIPTQSVKAFLDHALEDFNKIDLNKKDKELKAELLDLAEKLDSLDGDLQKRLRWTEKVMTIRCRLQASNR